MHVAWKVRRLINSNNMLKPIQYCMSTSSTYTHRKRMKTEAEAKVVASVWGTEFIQFLAALAIVT